MRFGRLSGNHHIREGVGTFVPLMAKKLALAVGLVALVAAAPASGKGDLWSIRYGAHGNVLVPYDPVRLMPSGPALEAGPFGHAWSISPDRTRLVSAAAWPVTKGQPAALRFIDLERGRIEGTLALEGEFRRVVATAWVRGRVLAAVGGGESTTVYAVDPDRRRLVGKVELRGNVVAGEYSHNGLVLLLERPGEIAPATLALVNQLPRARTVELARISVGRIVSGTGDERQMTVRLPGLALAPSRMRAYVFGAEEPAAAVDLRTMSVQYAPARFLTALKKNVAGWLRTAESLPDCRVVVAAQSYGGAGKALLRVVDPADWSSRELASRESWFRVGGGMIFTRGAGGVGLRMWKRDGQSVDLFRTGSVAGVFVVGPRALVTFHGSGGQAAVVELDTQRVVRHSLPAHPLVGYGQRIG